MILLSIVFLVELLSICFSLFLSPLATIFLRWRLEIVLFWFSALSTCNHSLTFRHNQALGLIGLLLGDKKLVDFAISGVGSGFEYHMSYGVQADGGSLT